MNDVYEVFECQTVIYESLMEEMLESKKRIRNAKSSKSYLDKEEQFSLVRMEAENAATE